MKKRKKTQNTTRIPILFVVAGGILLALAAALMLTQNGSGSTPQPPQAAADHEEETYPEIPRVSLEDAKAALDAGTAVFVDVRAAEAYQASHVADSINIPLAELETRLAELDQAQWIITYCT